jgi:phosphoribosylformimino-5-aminoimidazole carboxamide ribotide isomerase
MRWKNEGANKLHVIDLDAAFNRGNNLETITEIVRVSQLPVQVGGGIRSYSSAEVLLRSGASNVILGALAFSDAAAIRRLQKKFGEDAVVVAVDNKDGYVMVEGWKTSTKLKVEQAIEHFIEMHVKTFLVTSITQDGTLSGPDLETLRRACKYTEIKVIAAGGISCIADLVAVKNVGAKGAVVGKALYEGRFTLREAINAVRDT